MLPFKNTSESRPVAEELLEGFSQGILTNSDVKLFNFGGICKYYNSGDTH